MSVATASSWYGVEGLGVDKRCKAIGDNSLEMRGAWWQVDVKAGCHSESIDYNTNRCKHHRVGWGGDGAAGVLVWFSSERLRGSAKESGKS